jgi:hypothetical protein
VVTARAVPAATVTAPATPVRRRRARSARPRLSWRSVAMICGSTLPAGAERFDAKTTVLIETVTHHIEEEEQDWFPKVRAGLSRKQLQEIGARLEQARKKAPRSPAQPSALKKTIDAVIS